MKATLFTICVFTAWMATSLCAAEPTTAEWSGKAAASYLDSRVTWWMGWQTAARDHETFCVSCHTVLPYTMGRPALRGVLHEEGPSPVERKVMENVSKRVRMWEEVKPFYPDAQIGNPKTAESRGTESILNALVLASYDAPNGKLSPDTKLAFDNMWAEQLHTGEARGAWNWLQFHNKPFEGDSQYYGAALAALAVGMTPADYKLSPAVRDNVQSLREYLVRDRESQDLINRMILLWASTKVPGLLTPAQQHALIDEALSKQQADGGFSLSAFVGDWKRRDKTPLEAKSDGYATGVVTYVLQQAGMARTQPQVARGLTWLSQNQEKTDGRWLAYSLNKQRDLSSDVGRFMSDAATAYAVLALKPAQ